MAYYLFAIDFVLLCDLRVLRGEKRIMKFQEK